MIAIDLFSCIGCHVIGFQRAGIETIALCEKRPARRAILAKNFPEIDIYEAVEWFPSIPADIIIGGPPCQRTSVASAIHGYRSGASLWPWMLSAGINACAEWFVVEQPPGNSSWEAEVSADLSGIGYHVARFEFGAHDIGAPYIRRRVFLVACTSLQRLALTRAALPSAIDTVKRAADARGSWSADQLGTLRVDAQSAGEMDRDSRANRVRTERIEALGDSNPPEMAEVIGRAIMASVSA
ncbi:MAG TPA: DNA cytosine methyltransferase [Aliidongia sp.]|uniref:DNA cytosine methyltransferase n=1 Tax=Aliidongia sp. TaxID=1914230 RepID=UPI002DDCDCD5|nr:DNA cytosine methyltransferase [Aliidongia sp.]HEV2674123.1 DNA cytosine methyltransferase [Aliidongia sp.]